MKVLFLSWAYPKKNTPYLGIWAHQQALALRETGVEVDVVSSVPYVPQAAGALSEKIRRYSDIPDQERVDGITVYHPKFLRAMPNSVLDKLMFRLMGWQTRRLAERLERQVEVGRYEVLHAHNLFPDGAMAYRLHRKYGIPYVLTLHDVDRFNSFADKGGQRALSEAILTHARKVLVVSRRVGSRMDAHIPDGKMQLLYNTFWTKEHPEAAEGPCDRDKRKRIITIASLISRKGVFELLRAFRAVAERHPDYELLMVGQGKELPKLKRLAEELRIEGKVAFTGALPHEETMKELSRSAVFCLPSWDEAFGVVYAEAMSFGIPVIGCKDEGIADVVTHGDNGLLVESRNIGELEKALLYLIENPEEAGRIGRKGRECVRELRPDAFGRRLAGIYREVVK